jgi:hypothetical protein
MKDWERAGRVWLRGAAGPSDLDALAMSPDGPGQRMAVPPDLGSAGWVRRVREVWLGAFPVRIVGFDKRATANWSLPWHQDRVIAVRERHDVPGFTNWSRKRGLWHCEPPREVLDRMLFVRVHLDDCDAGNGAMEIAPGSHRLGAVPESGVVAAAGGFGSEVCVATAGDVLVLRMLTLHRSGRSESARPRRVLRVDFALDPLPAPLQWAA